MGQVRVGRTRYDVLPDGRHRTSAVLRYGDTKRRLWMTTSSDVPFLEHHAGDLWLPPLLLLAMRRGERLRLSDPISPGRRAALRQIQEILTTWYPTRMQRVRISAPDPEPPSSSLADRVRRRLPGADEAGGTRGKLLTATCFTGGLDSFYTLAKNRKRVDALLYAYGVDVPLHEMEATRRVESLLKDVAGEYGTRLLEVRTNLKRALRHEIAWGFEWHGAGLASFGTLFTPVISRLYLPATLSYIDMLPWGSHPLLDPLWSTSRLKIVHDGAEASRIDKLRRVVDDPVARRHLRVCFTEFADSNCARCLKCLRTMASLKVLGRLQDVETFPQPFDVERFRALRLRKENDVTHVLDLLQLVQQVGGHDDIGEACEHLLADYAERRLGRVAPWRSGSTIEPPTD